MIAPITSPEIIKLACVLAFVAPCVMIGGAGLLYGAGWVIGRLWRIGR